MIFVDGLYGSGAGAYAAHIASVTGSPVWRPFSLLPVENPPTLPDLGMPDSKALMFTTVAELAARAYLIGTRPLVVVGTLLSRYAVDGAAKRLRAWRLWIYWMQRAKTCKHVVVDAPAKRIRDRLTAEALPIPGDLAAQVSRMQQAATLLPNTVVLTDWLGYVPGTDPAWAAAD